MPGSAGMASPLKIRRDNPDIDDKCLPINYKDVVRGEDGWNIFNFLIVVYLLVGPLIPVLNDPKIFHILRVMRLLQVCMLVKGLARMIRVIFKAIPNLLNIMFLLFILMLVFAMLGVILFSNTIPGHFGNLGKALYSLFVCITQDGWLNIYQAFENEGNALKIGGAIYFVVFLTGGAFICANLLVAVVMSSLEESLISHKKRQKKEHVPSQANQPILEEKRVEMRSFRVETRSFEKLRFPKRGKPPGCNSHGSVPQEKKSSWERTRLHCHVQPLQMAGEEVDTDRERSLRFPKTVMWDKTSMFTSQEQLSTHLPNLNKKSFNNLCILLHSIQDNLSHYKEIREEINTIVEEVRAMDFNQAQEQELIMRSYLTSADNPYSSDRDPGSLSQPEPLELFVFQAQMVPQVPPAGGAENRPRRPFRLPPRMPTPAEAPNPSPGAG
ncbi:PREDICTED: cation channel sperm-associated protein 4 [Tinamus guttatus]|uniref:cation channel sperm-associated protein 4 n=1 Tax=Tinamus guttatus TaxID=94827 RepID=UPI00052EA939|nr:PREDICTED: cation channel sperm-associated protein 4 [Tinamus guttatus]